MKSLVLFFLFIGLIMIIMGQNKNQNPLPFVEYRYIPKSFTDEQYERLPIMSTFGKLFTHHDPWINQETYSGGPGIYYPKKELF